MPTTVTEATKALKIRPPRVPNNNIIIFFRNTIFFSCLRVSPITINNPKLFISFASEIEVYVSVPENLLTVDEVYALFRGENPLLNIFYFSKDDPKLRLSPENAVYPSLEKGYNVIRYRLPIKSTNWFSFLAATVDANFLKSKKLKIVGDFRPTFSCQEALPESNIFGLPTPGFVNEFFNDRKGCGYFKKSAADKTYRFHIISDVPIYDK